MIPLMPSPRLARMLLGLVVMSFTLAARGQEPEQPLDAGDLFRKYQKALVVIKGRGGSGVGAYVRMGGRNYIVTSEGVLAQHPGFKAYGQDGRQIVLDAVGVDATHNLARLDADNATQGFSLLAEVNKNAKVGDDVLLLSNNGGAGVLAPLQGRILGIGPQLIEVDVVADASSVGGPIIHIKTGKIIGVTFRPEPERSVSTLLRGETEQGQQRQFGQRLDLPLSWETLAVTDYENELRQIEAVQKRTRDFALLERNLKRVQFPNASIATGLSEPLRGQTLTFERAIITAASARSTAVSAANSARSAAPGGSSLTRPSRDLAADAAARAKSAAASTEAARASNTYNNLWGQYLSALRQSAKTDVESARRGVSMPRHGQLLDREAELRSELLDSCTKSLEQMKLRGPPTRGRGERGSSDAGEDPFADR
jgi:hypothetical protein